MRKTLFGLYLLVASLMPVSAQYALDVDAIVGFNGVFRAGTWTPVHVTIQNLGQDVRGELSLEIERGERFGPDRYAIRYSREIELVSGSSKAFSFVVPLETTVYPLTIRVTDGVEVAHVEEYELLGRSVPAQLTLVLARRPNLDFLLPLYNTRDERVLDVVYPLPGYLPEQWQGYEAVDIIVVHDARLGELSPQQVDAIRQWVASGGRLVISGGAHFGPADAQILATLGDFRTSGIATTTVEELGLQELGIALDPDERGREVVVTEFERYGTSITRTPIGRGDVVLLPADYVNLVGVAPLSSVSLWNSLLSRRASENTISTQVRRRVFETDILANQLGLPLYDFPSRLLVFGLAVSYLVGLAGILYWLSRGRDRLRAILGTPAILGIIAAVTITGHLALTRTMQPVEALALSIERAELVAEGGHALVTRDTALFSRQRADYRIDFSGDPLLIPMEQRDHLVHRAPERVTQEVMVDRWGHQNNVAFQIVPLALSARVASGDDYVEVELANQSRRAIRGVVALRNGFPERLGELLPGDVIEHVASGPPALDFQAIRWTDYVPDDELAPNRARLLSDIARRQRFDAESGPPVIIVGWTSTPLLPVSVTPEFERTIDLHVVTIPLYFERGDS